jgi:hypothetical protein
MALGLEKGMSRTRSLAVATQLQDGDSARPALRNVSGGSGPESSGGVRSAADADFSGGLSSDGGGTGGRRASHLQKHDAVQRRGGAGTRVGKHCRRGTDRQLEGKNEEEEALRVATAGWKRPELYAPLCSTK